jgi:hypothetical protein
VEPVRDAALVREKANGRAQAIAAVYEANRLKIQAAQQLSRGDAGGAEQQMGKATEILVQAASASKHAPSKKRLDAEVDLARSQLVTTKAAKSAPAPVQRSQALELNAPAASPAGR